VLDLVGIPSIFWCEAVLLRNTGVCCSIGDSLSQASHRFQPGMTRQSKPCPMHPNLRGVTRTL
jgi:hypothetical protein